MSKMITERDRRREQLENARLRAKLAVAQWWAWAFALVLAGIVASGMVVLWTKAVW